jgi:hypothetical protein
MNAYSRLSSLVLMPMLLAACSKTEKPAEPQQVQPTAQQSASTPSPAAQTAFVDAAKKDFALQFVTKTSEACAGTKGREFPDFKTGSPMQYSAQGDITWGTNSVNYVHETAAKLVFINSQQEKTFTTGIDISDPQSGNRKYVFGLSQLKGESIGATVTDETKAVDGNLDQTTGNLCQGHAAPDLVTQGAWGLAAKHIQVPKTTLSCFVLGSLNRTDVTFSFDGKTIQANELVITQEDSRYSEQLIIDPQEDKESIVYEVNKPDGTSVSLGISQPKTLTFAQVRFQKDQIMMCGPK